MSSNGMVNVKNENDDKALLESENKFRQMFMQHSAVKLLIDPEQDGKIIEVNPAALQFYGYSRHRFLQMKISDINMLPEDKVKQLMNSAVTQTREHFEFQHRLADGRLIDVEVHSSPLVIDGKILLHSIIRDISGRKKAERELQKQNAYLSSFMENAPAIFYSFVPGKGGMHHSPQIEGILAMKPEDFEKNPMVWHESIHPDDLPRVDAAIARCLR